ncbi:MAG: SAVED domain-containing protein, partial [Candidatus Hodarchaeota archaeon]
GRNRFDRRSFDEMIKQEKLVVLPSPDYSEIAICSFPQEARRPHDVQAAYLDLSELFEGRFPRTESYWEKEIPSRVVSFLKSDSVRSLPPPIHLFFDCHLSIAFLAGNLLNPKFGIQVIPAQKTRTSGYEFWPESRSSRSGLWHSKIVGTFNTEAVAAISVTNPIENHLLPFLQEAGLNHLPRVELHPVGGIGPRAVADGEHAWQLGFELQTLLRSHLPATCHTIHLFFSAPAALAYIFGNTLRHVTNTIKLYEHDFERSRGELAYYGSLQLPIKEETLV